MACTTEDGTKTISAARLGSGGARQELILPEFPSNQQQRCAHRPQKNGNTDPAQMSGGSACIVLRCILSVWSILGKQSKTAKPFGPFTSVWQLENLQAPRHGVGVSSAAGGCALRGTNPCGFQVFLPEFSKESDVLAGAGWTHLLLLGLINCILNYDIDYYVE